MTATPPASSLLPGFDHLAERYLPRTAGSRRLNEEQRPAHVHTRASNRFDARWKDFVYPIVAERGAGARIWDVDGNEYVDMTMGLGTLLFGHGPAFVDRALRAQLDAGNQLGAETAISGEVAALLADATGHERVAFVNTGSEATMTAIRVARAVTGRPLVAQFAGSYHGWYDGLIGRPDDTGQTVAPLPGMRDGAVADTVILPYGDAAALDRLRALGPRLAAIMVEPVQTSNVALQPKDFLVALRALADEVGAVLIFDEMVTGFRLARGGAQEWYGVRADLGTYGKILGGGLAIGAIAGPPALMDAVDGGAWSYGDDSAPDRPRTLFGGTFSRNPLGMAAARAVLRELEARGPELYAEIGARAARLDSALVAALADAPATYAVTRCESLIVIRPETVEAGELLSYHLADRGVFAWIGGPWYVSTAHSDADCDQVADAVADAVAELPRP